MQDNERENEGDDMKRKESKSLTHPGWAILPWMMFYFAGVCCFMDALQMLIIIMIMVYS